MKLTRLDLKMCNCAKCGKELLSPVHAAMRDKISQFRLMQLPPLLFGRIDDRPYCLQCFKIKSAQKDR